MERKYLIICIILILAIAATILVQLLVLPQMCKATETNGIVIGCMVSYSGYLFILDIIVLSIMTYMLIRFHYGKTSKSIGKA